MAESDPLTEQDVIDQAAIAWFVRLRDRASDAEDAAAFARWRAADPRHARAWDAMEELWAGLDVVAPTARRRLPDGVADLARRRAAQPSRRALLTGGLAASLALVVGGGTWLAAGRGAFADHRTGIGERRAVHLPDGSLATLGAASALSLDFDPARRVATLLGGEAFVTVAGDAARPFTLRAAHGEATIAAASTDVAFEARIAGGAARFTVARGELAVSDSGAFEARLRAGEQIRVGAAGLGAIAPVDPAGIAAWRDGRIEFKDAPLGEVIDDLQRYLPARIFMLDGTLDGIAVTGVFEASRAEAALRTIADTLPIRLVRIADLLIFVTTAG